VSGETELLWSCRYKKNPAMKTILTALALVALVASMPAQVIINEYSVSNLDDYPDSFNGYEDWIELYNPADVEADISGYHLSDAPAKPAKWTFPAGTVVPAGGHLVVWASGRDLVDNTEIHTNFKLSQTKNPPESIVFSAPDGTILEEIPLEITQLHHSRGRITDGNSQWGIFVEPTPGAANTTAWYTRYAQAPEADPAAGFYPGAVTVALTTTEPGATIYYTLDGHEPDLSSPVYSNPITLHHTRLLKARTLSPDPKVLPSFVTFNTYFINESHDLRVVSVGSDDIEELLGGNKDVIPTGSFEFFDEQGNRKGRGYGDFNSHGQDSWVHPQRSIDFVLRDEMGYASKLHYKLYKHSDREAFQRIILRAAGDDNYPGIDSSTHLRDIYVQTLADQGKLHLDMRRGARCVLYVNGNYRGIYATREKVDDPDYTKYYYKQSKYDLDFIMVWGDTWVEYGNDQTMSTWQQLYQFIVSHDMSIDSNYQKVTEALDVTSLVDYVLVNSFVVCTDWLNWNVGWWRGRHPDGTHRRWGYILWDEDATFNHYINYTNVPSKAPDAPPCYPEGLDNSFSDPEHHITILKKLRDNPEFDQYYISRYMDLANSTFSCDNMLALLDSMSAEIDSEMPRHVARWGGSYNQWKANVQKLRNFIAARCVAISPGLNDCYDLTGPYPVVLDVSPAGSGTVTVNSLNVSSFPWTGDYHGGIDLLLKARPAAPGFVFDHWALKNHTVLPTDTEASVRLSLTEADTIVAHFKMPVVQDSLVINEINYNSAPDFNTRDWVEFYNPHDHPLDLTGWVFRDEKDTHEFEFPAGTSIGAHGFLVLCRDTAAFAALQPTVQPVIGNFDFGLSNGGELLRLYDASGALVDTVLYDDKAPWPVEPDGTGPTLELISPALDNALASSWKAWSGHGTPGAPNHGISAVSPVPADPLHYTLLPNPLTGRAHLRIEGAGKPLRGFLEIVDLFGRRIARYPVADARHILLDGSRLSPGTYFFRFSDGEGHRVTGRFVVVH